MTCLCTHLVFKQCLLVPDEWSLLASRFLGTKLSIQCNLDDLSCMSCVPVDYHYETKILLLRFTCLLLCFRVGCLGGSLYSEKQIIPDFGCLLSYGKNCSEALLNWL